MSFYLIQSDEEVVDLRNYDRDVIDQVLKQGQCIYWRHQGQIFKIPHYRILTKIQNIDIWTLWTSRDESIKPPPDTFTFNIRETTSPSSPVPDESGQPRPLPTLLPLPLQPKSSD